MIIDGNKCEAGCKIYTCGSIRHDKNCKNYPESVSEMIDELQKENEELREAIKQVLSISDLWLINPENCPPEHRGEMEVLENMHGKLLKLTNNEN